MNYNNTLKYLFSQLPMYQRTGSAAYKENIDNIIKASHYLDNPHEKFKCIHIAGTNGKGSTAHLLASILQEAGFKTGLYTSPHLKDFRERIKINGNKISKNDVVNFVNKNKEDFEKINLSFFEYTVAMAFYEFSQKEVDIAVIETGLGGRLDSTNIISPEISIITNIGYDHTNFLGDTLEKIAFEKAGIIKHNTPVLIGRKQKEVEHIFTKTAISKNAKLIYSKKHKHDFKIQVANYQKENINTAISAIKILDWNVNENHIISGIEKVKLNTGLRGRWEELSNKPKIICDTGHNLDGFLSIVNQLKEANYCQLHFVFGTVNDKNLTKIFKILPKKSKFYFCKANIERALDSEKLRLEAKKYNLIGESYGSVRKALQEAKKNAKKNDLILIGGSTFVVAEVI